MKPEKRFWNKVDKRTTEHCWNWKGTIIANGYGQIQWDGKLQYAHRVSFAIHNGKMPKITDHLCRNRRCVNPNHLESVTMSENIFRSIPYRCFVKKIKLSEIPQIIALLSQGHSQKQVAAKYGVSQQAIHKLNKKVLERKGAFATFDHTV